MTDRVLVHKHVWIKDGPVSAESLALLVAEGWTVWTARPAGSRDYPSRFHFYDLVKDISGE